ncbi:MAG: carboxylating nicotinate-nucleotide diphosphorylase [Planctomycetaceae bacterium]|jgi:nicotinate-nucleotide pyrophosphorylase (carboxylating)|nr:carboxylating nicotinate-nucleotide diphosphorylase [Planctomycetaceae bacterium]
MKDFYQNNWNESVEQDLTRLLTMAIDEDISPVGDITSQALIPSEAIGSASVVIREDAVISGIKAIPTIINAFNNNLKWEFTKEKLNDGQFVPSGTNLGRVVGSVQKILMMERLLLNLVGKLTGISTLTKKYVDIISGTSAKIYDTRKTTLGWRRLEKYAVRCGGGYNHRMGLYDAILIKDNHLAFGAENSFYDPAEAIVKAKDYIKLKFGKETADSIIIEIEVDNLDQLAQVLTAEPDIVLLDNMPPDILRQAVQIRNSAAVNVQLEASGGVKLTTVKAIAESGVERISAGALTHSATSIDIGLDWINL